MFTTYIVYSIFLFSSTFILFLSKFRKSSIFFLILSFILIILISSLRAESVGTDNPAYSEWYNSIDLNLSLYELITLNIIDFEPGFVILNYVIKSLDFNYNLALVFYSILVWGPIFYFYKYFKNYFYFVIFTLITLGYLFFTFNGQRQAIAIGFIFLATKYLYEKKNIKFIISIIIATSFHFSAILFSTIYYIFKIPKLPTFFWIFLILFSLFFPLSYLFYSIGKVANLFPFYSSYLLLDNFTQSNNFSPGVFYQVILEFIILLYYRIYAKTNLEIFIFHLFLIGAISYNLFYGNLFLSRLVVYLLYFQAIVFAIIFSNFLKTKKYIEALFLTSIFLVMFYYKIQFSDSNCSPYITIFSK